MLKMMQDIFMYSILGVIGLLILSLITIRIIQYFKGRKKK